MQFLHVMIRTKNLEDSINFYTKVFDMQLIKKTDYPNGRFTLAFIGYGGEEDNTLIELTYNWDVNHYDLGNAFGHLAIGVDDIHAICNKAKQHCGKIVRDPAPMKFGGARSIAFIEDLDGYKIELIQLNK